MSLKFHSGASLVSRWEKSPKLPSVVYVPASITSPVVGVPYSHMISPLRMAHCAETD